MEAPAAHLRVVKDSPVERDAQEGFIEDLPGGLPVYANPTIEGVESTWTHLDSQDDAIQFKRGAVAHVVSVERVYGQGNLKEFATKMKVSYSVVVDWMDTYRRLLRLSDERRERVLNLDLRYSHYRSLNGLKNDGVYESLLLRANKKHWTVGKLCDALYEYRKRQFENAVLPEMDEPQEFQSYASEGEVVGTLNGKPITDQQIKDAEFSAQPPTPPKIDPAELDGVGKDYERDVIERFTDWLQDEGIVLVDEYGQVLKFYEIVEKYSDELL